MVYYRPRAIADLAAGIGGQSATVFGAGDGDQEPPQHVAPDQRRNATGGGCRRQWNYGHVRRDRTRLRAVCGGRVRGLVATCVKLLESNRDRTGNDRSRSTR